MEFFFCDDAVAIDEGEFIGAYESDPGIDAHSFANFVAEDGSGSSEDGFIDAIFEGAFGLEYGVEF